MKGHLCHLPQAWTFLLHPPFVQTCDTFHFPPALVAIYLMNVSLAPEGLVY